MSSHNFVFLGILSLLLVGFVEVDPFQSIPLVEGFPEMHIPADNTQSKTRIALGRKLFYDPILSLDSTISCASCHKQKLAFADSLPISPGVKNRIGNRNAPTLANVGYNPTYLFDGFLESLEKQVVVPIEEHAEMAFNMVEASKRLKRNKEYVALSKEAYNRAPDPFVITRSLSSFQRTFVSNHSKYDLFLRKKVKFTKNEERGRMLFFNELHCSNCHNGFNFTNFSTQNNGFFEMYADSGRMRVTRLEVDRDLFKVPTLRNIALTAPYMHDGSFSSLREVIQQYEKNGFKNKNKHPILQPFSISLEDEDALIAFLNTLTDHQFITNKKFSKPKN
ncbi:cytochrome-c peroxidase [Fluviicola taffensis]|nr:cytochrome c peroxidase [Fluviicola taffensis]